MRRNGMGQAVESQRGRAGAASECSTEIAELKLSEVEILRAAVAPSGWRMDVKRSAASGKRDRAARRRPGQAAWWQRAAAAPLLCGAREDKGLAPELRQKPCADRDFWRGTKKRFRRTPRAPRAAAATPRWAWRRERDCRCPAAIRRRRGACR